MDPSIILDKIVASRIYAVPKATKVKTKTGEIVSHRPFNQCVSCKVVNAYMLVLPTQVHEPDPLTGKVSLKSYGEAYYECKYCHIVKSLTSVNGRG